ncbi:MAG: hypothetical protein NTV29_07340 [Planctomycetota bacterium]|nr:hypothetical protein [Planctomycetota bacterium]
MERKTSWTVGMIRPPNPRGQANTLTPKDAWPPDAIPVPEKYDSLVSVWILKAHTDALIPPWS